MYIKASELDEVVIEHISKGIDNIDKLKEEMGEFIENNEVTDNSFIRSVRKVIREYKVQNFNSSSNTIKFKRKKKEKKKEVEKEVEKEADYKVFTDDVFTDKITIRDIASKNTALPKLAPSSGMLIEQLIEFLRELRTRSFTEVYSSFVNDEDTEIYFRTIEGLCVDIKIKRKGEL